MKKYSLLFILFFIVATPCFAGLGDQATDRANADYERTYGNQPRFFYYRTSKRPNQVIMVKPTVKSFPVNKPVVAKVKSEIITIDTQSEIKNLNSQISLINNVTKDEEVQINLNNKLIFKAINIIIGIVCFIILEIIGLLVLARIIKENRYEI